MDIAEQPAHSSPAARKARSRPHKRFNLTLSLTICLSGWLIPGLAHVVLGRWIRGIIFAASILTMFFMGLAMKGVLYGAEFEQPLQIFAFFANLGAGLPYIAALRLGIGAGTITASTYDYATTFLWVAGLLNYLVVLDAFDITQGRKP